MHHQNTVTGHILVAGSLKTRILYFSMPTAGSALTRTTAQSRKKKESNFNTNRESSLSFKWFRTGWYSNRLPAEVEQRPAGLRDVLVEPGEEVELSDGPRLVGLHVLQVEAANQEVVTPDVFGHQVHLRGHAARLVSCGSLNCVPVRAD